MRNYLFRGKTKADKWVYGSLISAGNYCCILESEDSVHPMDYPYLDNELGTIDGYATPVIPETVGMYTERKDKHGNPIFEGDIISGLMDVGPAGMCHSIVYVDFERSIGGYQWNYFDVGTIEIVGNIYDDDGLFDSLPDVYLIRNK